MAGLMAPQEMTKLLWPMMKERFDQMYAGPPLAFVPLTYSYRTLPQFGIFKIRG